MSVFGNGDVPVGVVRCRVKKNKNINSNNCCNDNCARGALRKVLKVAGPTGIEPAAYGLRVRRSGLTELRAHLSALEKEFPSTNIEVSLNHKPFLRCNSGS